ncbi:MAG: hypothetical protein IKQ04_03060 [Oscillospiraceae bacterium]|nr:hypothetical protein [Oscillospiraceae bacterium]
MSCEEPPKTPPVKPKPTPTPVNAPVSKPAAKSSAPVKVSVNELESQQSIFGKASKNLRSVMQTLNTAQKSIGGDRMFDATRRQLGKLSELLEIRAFVLDALAEAMTAATGGYKTAQTQSVKVMTECKAHKTDFYGNPVHVSGAVGAAGSAAAAGAAAPAEAPEAYAAAGSPAPQTAAEPNDPQTVNITQNITNIVNNYGAAESAAGTDAAPAAAPVTPAAETASDGISLGAAAAGMAGAAVLGGTAPGLFEMAKGKIEAKKMEKAKKQVDDQLAAAKQKLREIEEEENRITAEMAEGAKDLKE